MDYLEQAEGTHSAKTMKKIFEKDIGFSMVSLLEALKVAEY